MIVRARFGYGLREATASAIEERDLVKDRLGDHEKCGEEQVAEKGIPEKEQGGRETRLTGGQSLPPSR